MFCKSCLDGMDACPVDPRTPILLPSRPEEVPVKKKPGRQRRNLKPEELVLRMRSSMRLLFLALVVLFIAFLLTSLLALRMLDERDRQSRIGQNYSIVSQE